jgi:hypothetical protein
MGILAGAAACCCSQLSGHQRIRHDPVYSGMRHDGPRMLNNDRPMHEPVLDGTTTRRRTPRPTPEAPIGRQQRGVTGLAAGVDHMEEHAGALGVDGQKDDVIEDQDGRLGVGAQLRGEGPVPVGPSSRAWTMSSPPLK